MHRLPLAPGLMAITVLAAVLPVQQVRAADDVVVKTSTRSVKATIDALATALEGKGIAVAARIDHSANAATVGQSLPPSELLIFGNPKLGAPLMAAEPRVGLDLPMKVLAYEASDGKVYVTYMRPAALGTRHGLTGKDELLATMAKALDSLTDVATGANEPK